MTKKQVWLILAAVEAVLFSALIFLVLSARFTPTFRNADDAIGSTSVIFAVVAIWSQIHIMVQVALVLNREDDPSTKELWLDYVPSALPIATVIWTEWLMSGTVGKYLWWQTFDRAIFWIIVVATASDVFYSLNAWWNRRKHKREAALALVTHPATPAHAAPATPTPTATQAPAAPAAATGGHAAGHP